MEQRTNLLQGTLDLLILRALLPGEMHGLAISRRIEQMTGGTFQVKAGSLFAPFWAQVGHRLVAIHQELGFSLLRNGFRGTNRA